MFRYIKRTNISFFLFLFSININALFSTTDRKLSQVLNPGCTSKCGELIVVTAEGPNDILYYLWDFGHKPTFLFAEVPAETKLNIDWDNFTEYHEKSINFSNPPSYVFGVVINKMYEFNDEEDTGILHDDNRTIAMRTENFKWTILELMDDVTSNTISYSIGANGYHDEYISKNGSINITSYAYGSIGHAEDLPHLLHTENSSQIDLVIDHFTTMFAQSRFAVEFVTFSSNSQDSNVKLSAKKTLDDENTPGVFILDTLVVEDKKNENTGQSGFLQWRPIVYTSPDKVVSNSTRTFEYDVRNVNDSVATLNSSLLFAFYGSDLSKFLIKAENVSFGTNKDGWYSKTNFSSWSFLVGVGNPPEHPFSMLVFLIITIGLGLPTLIIAGGTVYMIYRKVRTGD